MTEQTDAAEVDLTEGALAEFLADALEPYDAQDCAAIAAANVFRSEWLIAALAAAEARGAERALREAADGCLNIAFECNEDVQDWLRARAAARGAEGGA